MFIDVLVPVSATLCKHRWPQRVWVGWRRQRTWLFTQVLN